MKVDMVRVGRPNLMGDRVDINAIKKCQKLEEAENKIGAFGNKKTLHRDKGPVKILEETERDKIAKFKELHK